MQLRKVMLTKVSFGSPWLGHAHFASLHNHPRLLSPRVAAYFLATVVVEEAQSKAAQSKYRQNLAYCEEICRLGRLVISLGYFKLFKSQHTRISR